MLVYQRLPSKNRKDTYHTSMNSFAALDSVPKQQYLDQYWPKSHSNIFTRWCPSSLAKLVQITPLTMVYGRYNELVNGVYKPTYNWEAPPCKPSNKSVLFWSLAHEFRIHEKKMVFGSSRTHVACSIITEYGSRYDASQHGSSNFQLHWLVK